MFVFFRAVTVALIVALALSALMNSAPALLLVALLGGSLWLVLAIILLFNWQVVTLFPDHLIFDSFGKKHQVFYHDIRAAKATPGEQGIEGPIAVPTLALHHQGAAKNPVKVNLANLAAPDRVILIRAIAQLAPHARLNDYAQAIAQENGKV